MLVRTSLIVLLDGINGIDSSPCIGYLGTKLPAMHLMAPEEWWNTWEVNIKGTYLPTYHLLKLIFSSNDIAPKPITILCTGYAVLLHPS